jgi:hypothetical protein
MEPTRPVVSRNAFEKSNNTMQVSANSALAETLPQPTGTLVSPKLRWQDRRKTVSV